MRRRPTGRRDAPIEREGPRRAPPARRALFAQARRPAYGGFKPGGDACSAPMASRLPRRGASPGSVSRNFNSTGPNGVWGAGMTQLVVARPGQCPNVMQWQQEFTRWTAIISPGGVATDRLPDVVACDRTGHADSGLREGLQCANCAAKA